MADRAEDEKRRDEANESAPGSNAETSSPSVPRFAEGFPRDADLDALVAAFDAGDFAQVREGVSRITTSDKDEAVKTAAKDLLARTKPDPLSALLLLLSALLLVLLSAWWVTHNGPTHPTHPTQ